MKKSNIEIYKNIKLTDKVLRDKSLQANIFINKIKAFEIKNKSKVLDVGCGLGYFGKAFQDNYNSDVYGIDLEKKSVNSAKSLGIKAQIADIDKKWPYSSQSFDIVLAVQILEHIFNPDNFFLETSRVLKKNGLLILTTPNLAAWYNRIIFLLGYQPFFTEVSTVDKTIGLSFTRKFTSNRETVGHLRIFTLRALIEIAKLYRFQITRVTGNTISYLPYFMKPLDKIFSSIPSLSSDLILIATK